MPNVDRTVYPNLLVRWNGSVITDDIMNLEWSNKVDLIEKSAGTESNKTYIAGRSDEDFTLDFAAVGTAVTSGTVNVQRTMYAGNSGTLEWAPFGTAEGNPKYSIKVIVESVTNPFKHYALGEKKAKLKANGTWITNYDVSGSTY